MTLKEKIAQEIENTPFLNSFFNQNKEKYIEIWMEGYATTGQSGTATRIWKGKAIDFDDAISKMVEVRGDEYLNRRDDGTYTVWACELFDNELAARKSFG